MGETVDPGKEFKMHSPTPLTGRPKIRVVTVEGSDGEALDHLAALSGGKPPSGAALVAELAGDPVAAIGLFDGHVVADRSRADLRLRLRLHRDRLFVFAMVTVIGV
jgi:hypothetical protein